MIFCLKLSSHSQQHFYKPVNVPDHVDGADSYAETHVGNTPKCDIHIDSNAQVSKIRFVIGCLSMASTPGFKEFTIRNPKSLDTLTCIDNTGKATKIESGWVYPLSTDTTIVIKSQGLRVYFLCVPGSDNTVGAPPCSQSRLDKPCSSSKAESVVMFRKRKYDFTDGAYDDIVNTPSNKKADTVTTSDQMFPTIGEPSQFKVGDKVELCDISPGYRGAWFPATIVKSDRDRFECEYDHFVLDSSTKKLREWKRMKFTTFRTEMIKGRPVQRSVSMWGIRPSPPYHEVKPPPPAECWPIGTIVEAKVTDAWWKGKVTSSLMKGDCVEVHFDDPPKGEGGKEIIKLHNTRKALNWDDAELEDKPKGAKFYGRWWEYECT